jgi:hypothetical protein
MTSGNRPLISSLDLAPQLYSVRAARRYATAEFQSWHVPADTVDNAITIISELAANALRHAALKPEAEAEPPTGRPVASACTLVLQLWPAYLLILVCDEDRRLPVLRHPSRDAESGRGLQLVDELSEAWGYALPEPAAGKVVWAQIMLPDLSEHEPERNSATRRPALPWELMRSAAAPET